MSGIFKIRDMPWEIEESLPSSSSGDDVRLRISQMRRVIHASPSIQGLLGYTPREILGLKIDSLCHDEDGWASFLAALEASGGVLRDHVMRLRGKDDSAPWASINARGREGKPGEVTLVARKMIFRYEQYLAIRKSRDHLRDLFAYEQKVRETEKARLARELHDGLGGILTMLTINLARLTASMAPELQHQAQDLASLVDHAIATTRRLITDLHPAILDDLGLWAAIAWLAEDLQRHTGIACRVDCRCEHLSLDPERALTLFRLVQEGLSNVVRHAQASEVEITCREEAGQLFLAIRDNGIGLARNAVHKSTSYGIRGMFERVGCWGGALRFDSAPGEGATLWVRLPLTDREEAA